MRRKLKVYASLAVLRVAASVLLLGMIHPDEYFQSQEIMARHFLPTDSVLRRELFVPWEFQLATPNRSVLFPALVVGLPFKVFELVGIKLTGWLMLVTPRLLLCAASFLIDAVLFHVVGKLSRYDKVAILQEKQEMVLMLFASSWPTLLFLCRPFSNTFELLVFALCFAVLYLIKPTRRVLFGVLHAQTILLGSLLALGVFTRFTFPVFFFPLGVELVRQQDAFFIHASRKKELATSPSVVRRIVATIIVVMQGVGAFISWGIIFVLMDTLYYRPELFHGTFDQMFLKNIRQNAVIAPFNNLLYNTQYDNLKLHGVHPRFTHFAVNMPMLFGPLFVAFVLQRFPNRSVFGTLSVLFPLACLSLAPHQEPRFLLPIMIPLYIFTVLNGNIGMMRFVTSTKSGQFLWIVFNLTLTLFFGVLHQGGIVPMLLSLSSIASTPTKGVIMHLLTSSCHFNGMDDRSRQLIGSVPLVFARTYMPPRFLLTGMTVTSSFQVIDVAGNDLNNISDWISVHDLLETKTFTVLLVLPASVTVSDVIPFTLKTVKLGSCTPHLSTEDFSFELLSLELYLVNLMEEQALSIVDEEISNKFLV
ncbi:hypothetical protein CCR75_005934 [Bremia lactucae]|uniref:Mannosyltransferase n=1 Tax=Bremia lactucae TaxID=4779 RepID=A0A976ILA3_BRELC|nr:hypothetical protein CCR75_005934 [Bremia lactucae]